MLIPFFFFSLTYFPFNLFAFRESVYGWFWKTFSSGVSVYERNPVVLGCHMQNAEIGKWGETPLYEGWIHWGLWCTSTLSRDWFCWLLQQSSKAAKVWHSWSHVCSSLPEEQSQTCKFIIILPFWLRVLFNISIHLMRIFHRWIQDLWFRFWRKWWSQWGHL